MYCTKLKIFKCLMYAHMKQEKLEPRALKAIFIGYPPERIKVKKLSCIDFRPLKCIISRNVILHEIDMIKSATNHDKKIYKDEKVEFEVELTEKNAEKVNQGVRVLEKHLKNKQKPSVFKLNSQIIN